MTLTRYNEIMERVEVTPEPRARVLDAAAAAAQPKRRSARKPWVLAAACLVLILLGSLTLPRLAGRQDPARPTEVDAAPGIWQAEDYDSAEALSAAAGFEVPQIPALRGAEETSCTLIGGKLAQIGCVSGGRVFTWRVSPGSEDNSGDYNEYPDVRTAALGGTEVTFKGEGESCALALWEKGGFSYSLACDGGLPRAEMEALVLSVLES